MTEDKIVQTEVQEMWATIDLMGHGQAAGRISHPSDWGGLLRVDVPTEDGGYRTEFYGISAIYAVKLVSEEIARAYTTPSRAVIAYDTPIVTREQHQSAMRRAEQQNYKLESRIRELERKLIATRALPEPEYEDKVPF